jgi:hypothetical protein
MMANSAVTCNLRTHKGVNINLLFSGLPMAHGSINFLCVYFRFLLFLYFDSLISISGVFSNIYIIEMQKFYPLM